MTSEGEGTVSIRLTEFGGRVHLLMPCCSALLLGLVCACSGSSSSPPPEVKPAPLQFVDVTRAAGVYYDSSLTGPLSEQALISGGVAAGDYDRDGWVDLYVVRDPARTALLFRNLGDGTFEEVGEKAGVAVKGANCGPTFADIDGDGYPDLFIGGINAHAPRLFWNQGDGTFKDITSSAGLELGGENTFSAAFGDYDHDGDLDLFATHWFNEPRQRSKSTQHLWRNNGDRTFTDVSVATGIASTIFRHQDNKDYTFAPNFADIDSDGWLDLLIAADFGTSMVYLNVNGERFRPVTDNVISDENGMGAAIGDYDNDGDLDWFVSSIWDPDGRANSNWGVTGNRLYRNKGNGTFEDVTTWAGVREGYWGWGASFADFDNDGHLDLIHVNGFGFNANGPAGEFYSDPTRLFMSDGDGTFTEASTRLGLVDRGQGRGIVCFDYDRDGDLDLFIANNSQPGRLFRNDSDNNNDKGNFLCVKLQGRKPNSAGIGARVYVRIGATTQMRELRCGCNFVSQNPTEMHFGLGMAATIDELEVVWPGGKAEALHNVKANQHLMIKQGP